MGTLNGGHTQGFPGGHNFRILILDLVEEANIFHLIDDVMAVVARSLIGTQGHHTARLLENNTWADNAINDADRTRINDH